MTPDIIRAPSAEYVYKMKIREGHLDTFGHVNNATYLELFEEARWELIEAGGFGMKQIKERGQGPVILHVDLTFKKELKNRLDIEISTVCLEYSGKVGVLEQKILSAGNVEHAVAKFKIGFFDTQARKLIEPTPEWLKAIGLT